MFFLSKNSVVLFSILYYTTRANKSLKQFFSSSFLGLRPPQVQPARGATTPRCTCRSPPASQTASETSSSPTTNRTGHRLGTAIDSATTALPPPSRNRTTTIAPAAPWACRRPVVMLTPISTDRQQGSNALVVWRPTRLGSPSVPALVRFQPAWRVRDTLAAVPDVLAAAGPRTIRRSRRAQPPVASLGRTADGRNDKSTVRRRQRCPGTTSRAIQPTVCAAASSSASLDDFRPCFATCFRQEKRRRSIHLLLKLTDLGGRFLVCALSQK